MRVILSLVILALLVVGCQKEESNEPIIISGETMGTYYRVTCNCPDRGINKGSFDSLLVLINASASTYIPTSIISQFNTSDSLLALPIAQVDQVYSKEGMFDVLWSASLDVAKRSGGYYDPTVMPLVNYWGFGYQLKKAVENVDSTEVERLAGLADFNNLQRTKSDEFISYLKESKDVQLDFSSIAKGLGVDLLSQWLKYKDCDDHLVDIGGELFASGMSHRGEPWVTGINVPDPSAAQNDIFLKLQVSNKGIASSGNYRNFYSVDGVNYGHTINPKSGFPERNELLSTTVIAEDCMQADAWATAFMSMGLDKALSLVKESEGIDALFIYNEDGEFRYKSTPLFDQILLN